MVGGVTAVVAGVGVVDTGVDVARVVVVVLLGPKDAQSDTSRMTKKTGRLSPQCHREYIINLPIEEYRIACNIRRGIAPGARRVIIIAIVAGIV